MRKGNLVSRLISKNETIDFSQIGGAYQITLRNIGNTPMRIMGIDLLFPFEIFSVDVPFAVYNSNFKIEFLSEGIINPENKAVLWYAKETTCN